MAFRPTDLPIPVAPATRRWGILARSTMYTSFVMVLPSARGNSKSVSLNLRLLIMLSIETIWGLALGTSIPMVPLPGMGAMIRIPSALRLNAMSSSRFLILLMRTPGAGVTSYSVMVGPTVALMLVMLTPKLLSTVIICSLFLCCSSMSIWLPVSSYLFNKSRVGYLYIDKSNLGS